MKTTVISYRDLQIDLGMDDLHRLAECPTDDYDIVQADVLSITMQCVDRFGDLTVTISRKIRLRCKQLLELAGAEMERPEIVDVRVLTVNGKNNAVRVTVREVER